MYCIAVQAFMFRMIRKAQQFSSIQTSSKIEHERFQIFTELHLGKSYVCLQQILQGLHSNANYMFSQTVAGTSSTTYPKVHLSMCHRCLHFNWILVHFNRVQALKCFRNCLAPDNAEINVSTRQLFITLIHKLKLYFIAPLQKK